MKNCNGQDVLCLPATYLGVLSFNDGNWTEWSAILSEIIRVISKIEGRYKLLFGITIN